jgi:GMP synthase-like glutamine amidotransferase
VRSWILAEGEHIPDGRLDAFDALVVFGGGMNVRDTERFPWLRAEVELLRDALEAELPTLGICLGAQLLATAGGAEVRRASEPEIGWREVRRVAEDRVIGAMPERFCAYEWHSYRFDLPPGSVELARSDVCEQAYRLGACAWGVQFHPEVTLEIVSGWAHDHESDPDAARIGFDPKAHIPEAAERLPEWNEHGRALFDAFLAVAREKAAAGRPAVAREA